MLGYVTPIKKINAQKVGAHLLMYSVMFFD